MCVVFAAGDPEVFSEGRINRSYIEKLLEQHLSGRHDYAVWLWALMNLELWYREYMLS